MQAKIETLKAKDDQGVEYVVYPRTLTDCLTNADGTGFTDVIRAIPVANAINADNAIYDSAGNNIAETFVKLQDGTINAGDSASLGGETASEWQGKIDKIQSVGNTANVSADGWYRIAEYSLTSDAEASGLYANGCEIRIRNTSKNSKNGDIKILLASAYGKQKFSLISSLTSSVLPISKIRYTKEGGNAYIEVYSLSNAEMKVFLTDTQSNYGRWKTIDFIATAETVSGVTVTTTYDIPANASPVTDLHLAQVDGTTALTTSILEKAVGFNGGGFYNFYLSGASYTGEDLPEGYEYGCATVFSRNIYKTVILWGRTGYPPVFNTYNGETWKGWNTFATTSDLTTTLAGYFPTTGGNLNGNIAMWTNTEGVERTFSIRSATKSIQFSVSDTSGLLYDNTLGRSIIYIPETKDVSNIFYGRASENLSLSGGGDVDGTVGVLALTLPQRNLDGKVVLGTNGTHLQIYENGGNMRGVHLDFAECASGLNSKLLHTGNSTAVVQSTSAPSDTTALWVDTANKVTKAYIDGAWTQVA